MTQPNKKSCLLFGCGGILILLIALAALLWYVVLPRTNWFGLLKKPDQTTPATEKKPPKQSTRSRRAKRSTGSGNKKNPAEKPPPPLRRTTTLIGTLKLENSGNIIVVVPANTYAGESTESVYLLDNNAPARKLLQARGNTPIKVILTGQITRGQTPPRIQLKSIRAFMPQP